MYYLVDNDPNIRFDNIDDVLNYCVTSDYYEDDTDSFNEYLDEEGNVDIAGYEFAPSDILYSMDREAYHRELSYWAENQVDYGRESCEYDLEHCSPGERVWVCNYQVYVYDDEEEEEEDEEAEDLAFDVLEERLIKQKQDEANKLKEEEKTSGDFLSTLGIQII